MGASIPVGLGEVKVSRQKDDTLVALGLGSCIAICAYDPGSGVAGIAHVVLPESTGQAAGEPGKFADTAVPALLRRMRELGADAGRITVALAGGAQLFSFGGAAPRMDVGARNACAVEDTLKAHGVRVLARDVGGKTGRTVRMAPDTGMVYVRTIGEGERELASLGQRRFAHLARAA